MNDGMVWYGGITHNTTPPIRLRAILPPLPRPPCKHFNVTGRIMQFTLFWITCYSLLVWTTPVVLAFSAMISTQRRPSLVAPSHQTFAGGRQHEYCCDCRQRPTATWAKRNENDEDSDKDQDEDIEELPLGMEEAFQQLDSLQSLDGLPSSESTSPPTSAPNSSTASTTSRTFSLPLEKEIEVYKDLVTDSDRTDDIYADVLSDMTESKTNVASSGTSKGNLMDDPAMQQALADAMKEVSAKNPSTKDALNDKEIMKEIQAIMERGNAELLASLEDIRQEQVSQWEVLAIAEYSHIASRFGSHNLPLVAFGSAVLCLI